MTLNSEGFVIKSDEWIVQQPTDILRIIPDWKAYFQQNAEFLSNYVKSLAQGGTLDSIKGNSGLKPIPHYVDIEKTRNLTALKIADLFMQNEKSNPNLGILYKWTYDYS